MKYCPHCGQLIRSDAVICPYCGYQQSRISRDEHITLIITVLNAGTLLFLGFQGLIRPFYINNMGTFVTVILSLFFRSDFYV
ncbi:MAG: Hypothetical protein AJITA_00749 [Acetilactobacillus jinshanensis]